MENRMPAKRKPAKKKAKKPAKKVAKKATKKASKPARKAAKLAPAHDAPPPQAQLMQGLFGFMVTKGLSAVASMDVADALKGGPMYYTDLATIIGADQRALHRTMRMLASVGVFAETSPGTFGNNPVSDLLRSDVPGNLRDMAVMITSESHWLPWGRYHDTLRSGKSGPQHAFGEDVFTWFQREENKAEWDIFNRAMTSFSGSTAPLIAQTYDFSKFSTIVDVGGGHGLLLRTILETAPAARGILYDLPGVVDGADTLGGRIECKAGSFFDSVPAGADCYVMKHIIHDWSDEQCVQLLRNVANVMDPKGRVIVADTVMPESPEPHPAKFMDVNMLAMTEGGCERTEREFAALFKSAGLKLAAIHPTPSPVCVVEAAKA
jgi:hypothetical protein